MGVADGWSLYGGALADKHYQSAAMGVGRDLAQFGALAFDVTHSHVNWIMTAHTAKENWTATPFA